MPTIRDIITSATEDDQFLESLSLNHQRRLTNSIRSLRDKITNSLNELSTTSAGKLEGAKVNLKQSQKIHKEMVKLFETEYNQDVDDMLGDFSEIEKTIDRRYKALNVSADFTSIDRSMLDALKQNTYARYKEFGDDARNRIAEAMYQSVAGGQKMSTLVNTITGILTGKKDVRGRPMTIYAKGFAQDAVMNYQNQVTLSKGEAAGFTHWLYYGDVINTSRPFCITRVGKVYTKRQIQAWDSIDWQGKSGSAWTERGGYNCRHHWRPVKKEWFQNENKEDLTREETLGLMTDKAQLNQYDDLQKRLLELESLEKELKAKGKGGSFEELILIAQQRANVAEEMTALRQKLGKTGKKVMPRVKKVPPTKAPKAPAPPPKAPTPPPKAPTPPTKAPKAPTTVAGIDPTVKAFVGKVKYYVKNARPVGPTSKMFVQWQKLTDVQKTYYLDLWRSQGINVDNYKHLLPGATPSAKVIPIKKPQGETPKLKKPPSVVSVEEQLREAGVRQVYSSEVHPVSEPALDYIKQEMLNEVNSINTRFPGISGLIADRPVKQLMVTSFDSLAETGYPNANGSYNDYWRRMRIAKSTRADWAKADVARWGDWQRGNQWSITDFVRSPRSTFRHELGHHVLYGLEEESKHGLSAYFDNWRHMVNNLGTNFLRENVTEYSTTNLQEAFAETFAIYTRRDYRRGFLPKQLESFMDDLTTRIPSTAAPKLTVVDKIVAKAYKFIDNPMQTFAEEMKGSLWFDYKPDASTDYIRKGKQWFLGGKEVSKSVAKRLDGIGVPPAWTDVVAAKNPRASRQAIGRDAAGRIQYRYNADFMADSAKKKFTRVKSFKRDIPAIRKKIDAGMAIGDERAYLLELENRTAIRVGTDRDFKAKKKAYGLTTLQKEHVRFNGDKIIFDFTAKEGIPAHYELSDRNLAKWLKEKTKDLKKGEQIFSTDANKLNAYLEQIAGKKYTIKDFRTYHGTRIAFEELQSYVGKSYTAKQKKDIVKEVTTKVSKFLKNTPAMAKKSYIDPIVWEMIGGI